MLLALHATALSRSFKMAACPWVCFLVEVLGWGTGVAVGTRVGLLFRVPQASGQMNGLYSKSAEKLFL